jgi:Ca2+/Na+ antiporter
LRRIEPNLLLAIATGLPLLMLTLTATIYGAPGPAWRYPFLAGLYTAMFVALHRPLSKLMRMRTDRPPMIDLRAPNSILWAGIFPAVVMVMAAVPYFLRGLDFGILIVLASILFGQTVRSAMKAPTAD